MAKSEKVKTIKHVPMRTCIVSRQKLPKSELIRIVHTPEDEIVIDLKGKARGRGANISQDIDKFELALNKGILKRALRLKRELKTEEVESLRTEFKNALEEKAFRPNNRPVSIRVDKSKLRVIENHS